MPLEAQPLLFTTRDELESIAAQAGVDLYVDDNDDGTVSAAEEELVDECIWEATDEMAMDLLHVYTHDVLETSQWVRRQTSYLALHKLSERRNNPSVYKGKIIKLEKKRRDIRNGLDYIPRIAPKDDYNPKMANIKIDHNYGKSKIREDQRSSVDTASDTDQDLDWYRSSLHWW